MPAFLPPTLERKQVIVFQLMQYRKKQFMDLEVHMFAWALLALLAHTTEVSLGNKKFCSIPYFFHSNEREVNLARTDIRCITIMGLKQ